MGLRPRHLAIVLAGAILLILAYGGYRQVTSIPVLHATGRLVMTAAELKGASNVELATRDVTLGGVRRQQVQLPGETWIDCESDCRSAVLRAGPLLWEELQRRSR
jgi:hypothetical protein